VLEELLVNQRLHPRVIQQVLGGLTYEEENSAPAERLVAGRLSQLLKFDARISAKRRILVFVGPHGAGKTSVIAKLASKLQESFQLKVGLVEVNHTSLEAPFHLGTFAGLMKMPCCFVDKVAYQRGSKAYQMALADLDLCDVVLVDSDGRTKVPSVREDEIEPILVLPAAWRSEELIATARQYESTGYRRIAVSKIDACGFAGPLIEALVDLKKPLAFFSNGPRIPQDLEPASARRLGRMLTQVLH
jgi:flagellar biosynthesis protein FlhF